MCTDCSFSRVGPRRPAQASPLPDPDVVAPGLEIYPRAAWAGTDREPTGELYPESVYLLVVHHSAGPEYSSESEAIVEMQEIFDYHTGPTKNWSDVGYNFFVDRFGRAFEGRAGSLKGPVRVDSTGGSQGFAQSVCVLGDYTDAPPSTAAQATLDNLLAWLADRHKLETGPEAVATFASRGSDKWPEGAEVTINTISGHRDVSRTECPGDAFYTIVHDDLPTRVSDRRADGTDAVSAASTDAPSTSAPAGTTPATTDAAATTTSESSSSTTRPPASTTTSTTTTTSQATTQPSTTAPIGVSIGPPTSVPAGSSPPAGSTGSLELFTRGALGGAVTVGVVAGLAWIINRRRENGQPSRPRH